MTKWVFTWFRVILWEYETPLWDSDENPNVPVVSCVSLKAEAGFNA